MNAYPMLIVAALAVLALLLRAAAVQYRRGRRHARAQDEWLRLGERTDANCLRLCGIARQMRAVARSAAAADRALLQAWAADLDQLAAAHLQLRHAVGLEALAAAGRAADGGYLGEFRPTHATRKERPHAHS